MRREWGLKENEVVLLFAGSGWDERVELRYPGLRRISNQNVSPVGGGNRQKKAGTSKKVRFLGPVADMPSLFLAADIFVLPTVYDPFSNACLEALSYGLPVITTATNGFAEIIVSGVHGEVIERAKTSRHSNRPSRDGSTRLAGNPPARERCAEITPAEKWTHVDVGKHGKRRNRRKSFETRIPTEETLR